MLRRYTLLPMLPLLVGAAPAGNGGARTVAQAQADARAADVRSDELRVEAERAERDMRRTAARRRVLERQIAGEVAKLGRAKAALAEIARRRVDEERKLAVAREPLMRLTGALERMSRQPAGYALVRPGSVNDLVHVRAILDSTIPRIEARTQATRAAITRIEALRTEQAEQLGQMAAARVALADQRQALAQTEIDERRAAARLQSGSVRERARALALGEEARDIVTNAERDEAEDDVLAVLTELPPPPLPSQEPSSNSYAAYRLPVGGAVASGYGEVSRSGFRARGITIAADAGAAVVAPAAGTVRFARRYRSYGDIVIVDHGAGWTSLLTGLARLSVREGQLLRAGEPLGSADGAITLELRRKGRPVDVAAML